ncbi:hypothetical protein GZH47_11290 [Paenibacillus rhizovicinus]|uniref:Uncharacterized protein n=1 Tax=Paenibacillus rhizovicinus TaxID=2704463 RepID=A0A6C0NYS7_9BACL|nr:hypothetical protein [Paenibacillus rhizovicinus]QHW31368.1 hypothetical protein GZH47_11290 [Paenibacillus rhizovicinus]
MTKSHEDRAARFIHGSLSWGGNSYLYVQARSNRQNRLSPIKIENSLIHVV